MEKEKLEAVNAEVENAPTEEAEEQSEANVDTLSDVSPPSEAEIDQSEIETLREENAALRNQVLRTRADFENAKRRTEREKQDAIRFANKKIFFDLLGVMDNFERAMGSSADPDDPFVVGIVMIQKQLEDVLTQNGVKEVAALNQPFDPYNHEAFAKEQDDSVPENTVIEVFQKGYKFFDQLLRPATVKVSTAAEDEL